MYKLKYWPIIRFSRNIQNVAKVRLYKHLIKHFRIALVEMHIAEFHSIHWPGNYSRDTFGNCTIWDYIEEGAQQRWNIPLYTNGTLLNGTPIRCHLNTWLLLYGGNKTMHWTASACIQMWYDCWSDTLWLIGLVWFILRLCQLDNGYIDGRSQIRVHIGEWTQVHRARSPVSLNRHNVKLRPHWLDLYRIRCVPCMIWFGNGEGSNVKISK